MKRTFPAFPKKAASQGLRSYLWGTGQDDNIGDSLLRRGYLNTLGEMGPVVTWVGGASESYISGLSSGPMSSFIPSYWMWYLRAFGSSIRGKTLVAINAGELSVSGKGALRMLSLLPLIMVSRIRGGGGVWLGASIPNHRPSVRFAYSWAAQLCRLVRWRDGESQNTSGRGGHMPDWGFGLGSSPEEWPHRRERPYLGIVLRGDKEAPTDGWLDWIAATCEQLELKPHVVVQVERDAGLAKSIAQKLGASVTPWKGMGHAAQESAVRAAYRECGIVVGDRLHGLIVAATEGAVPFAWTSNANSKARRHFDVVGMTWVGQYSDHSAAAYPILSLQYVDDLRGHLVASMREAQDELALVESELRRIFAVGDNPVLEKNPC